MNRHLFAPFGRLLHTRLVHDIDRLHNGFHILRRHDMILVKRYAAGHLSVHHEYISVPGQVRFHLLIIFILQDLQGLFHTPDLLAVRGKLPQRHIGAGAQDIGSGILVFNLVKIFQIGSGFRKAEPHPGHIVIHHGHLQPQQPAAQVVPADPQPVKFPDHTILVLLKPGQT